MKKRFVIPLLLFSLLIGIISFVSAENLVKCTDSDEGINYYKKGTAKVDIISWDNDSTRPLAFTGTDYCLSDGTTVREYYCETQNSTINGGLVKITDYKCPSGILCQDGICAIPPAPAPLPPQPSVYSCTDSDGGTNYEEPGYVIIKLIGWDKRYTQPEFEEKTGYDNCGEALPGKNFSTILRESYCVMPNISIPKGGLSGEIIEIRSTDELYEYIEHECPSNTPECQSGVCVGRPLAVPPKLREITPDEETGPLEIPEESKEEYKCNGCELENKCYPFGYRKEGKFCSDLNNQFIEQKRAESQCENNFECRSNVCVSGECISEGLIQKIINWFKRLFGF